jgi:cytochrome c
MWVRAVMAFIASMTLQHRAMAEPPSSYDGRLLFMTYCMICHGQDGRGNGPLAR